MTHLRIPISMVQELRMLKSGFRVPPDLAVKYPMKLATLPMENTYHQQHRELHEKIDTAIRDFEVATGGKVTRIDVAHAVSHVSTTLMSPLPLQESITNELQRRLDFLDEAIDTLEREKRAAGDDVSIIDEAKQRQQKAREIFSRGDIYLARTAINYTDLCVGRGQRELVGSQKMSDAIEAVLRSAELPR